MFEMWVGSMANEPIWFASAEELFAEYHRLIDEAPARPVWWERVY